MSVRVDAVADQRQRVGDLAHADEADVGPAEPGIGDGGAGKIERLEARLGRERRGERIIDAGRDHDGLAREPRGKTRVAGLPPPQRGIRP